jgi:hypothetical protein
MRKMQIKLRAVLLIIPLVALPLALVLHIVKLREHALVTERRQAEIAHAAVRRSLAATQTATVGTSQSRVAQPTTK